MIKKSFGYILLIFGIGLICQGFFHFAKRQGYIKSDGVAITNPDQPQAIIIPKSKIDLPVQATRIENKKWPTSEIGVSYLENSGKFGFSGNHVFYGHNWKNLLGNLDKTKVGDEIIIKSSQSKLYTFRVKYVGVVESGDVSILQDTQKERLTLYTCTGFLDSKRLVVIAEPS